MFVNYVLMFKDAFNIFSFLLYGVEHMGKDHVDIERGNQLPPLQGLLFSISSNVSYICIIPQTGLYIPQRVFFTPVVEQWMER